MTSAHQSDLSTFSRLVRFWPVDGSSTFSPLIGEPIKPEQDVGLATYQSEPVNVEVFSGSSILSPGQRTGEIRRVDRILSPLAASEVGTIRCIGLNVSCAKSCSRRNGGKRSSLVKILG